MELYQKIVTYFEEKGVFLETSDNFIIHVDFSTNVQERLSFVLIPWEDRVYIVVDNIFQGKAEDVLQMKELCEQLQEKYVPMKFRVDEKDNIIMMKSVVFIKKEDVGEQVLKECGRLLNICEDAYHKFNEIYKNENDIILN